MDAGRDFEREIVVKVNAPEVLRVELRRPSWKRERVALGTNTDPYQWVEKRYGLTRAIFEVLLEARNPCSILTKSPLLLRDLDVFRELARVTEFSACLSIPTLDERAWRATEPHTPHPRARIAALAELVRAGIPTGVLVAPLMPGISDDPAQVQAVVEACEEAGAGWIGGQALFLRGSTKDVFMGWLALQRPDLVPLYERLYGRGAYLRGQERQRVEAPLRRAAARARGPRVPERFSRLAAAAGGTELRTPAAPVSASAPPTVQEALF
jgi:DNA repair photolyase